MPKVQKKKRHFSFDIVKLKRQIKQLKSVSDFLEAIKVAPTHKAHRIAVVGVCEDISKKKGKGKSFNNNARPDTVAVLFYLRTMSWWSWVAFFFFCFLSCVRSRKKCRKDENTSHKKEMKIEKNWAYEGGIPKTSLPAMHIDLLVKDGSLRMRRNADWYWEETLPKAQIVCPEHRV